MKNQYHYAIKLSLFTLSILFTPLTTYASQTNVLFEGYYKLSLQGDPIGYIISRMEYDKKKNHFISKQYIRMQTANGISQESVVTNSNGVGTAPNTSFRPISYKYTSQSKQKTSIVEGKVLKQKLQLTVSDGKTAKTTTSPLNPNAFFSSVLAYVMLHKGISEGKNFSYSAISEENGKVVQGKAYIKKQTKVKNLDAFEIFNQFDKLQFISLMSPTGEIFSTRLPVQKLKIELMKTPAEATLNQKLPSKTLITLFGEVPSGKTNALAKYKPNSPMTQPQKTKVEGK